MTTLQYIEGEMEKARLEKTRIEELMQIERDLPEAVSPSGTVTRLWKEWVAVHSHLTELGGKWVAEIERLKRIEKGPA